MDDTSLFCELKLDDPNPEKIPPTEDYTAAFE
jgi:hypothetical protein